MRLPRASGLLLHPTSLPSRSGIGDLGRGAYKFVDFLAAAQQRLWQLMPLGPTGYGDSPYQSFSAFAGNPLLISPEMLVDEGLLLPTNLTEAPDDAHDDVDYGAVIPRCWQQLHASYQHFNAHATPAQRAEFDAFCEQERYWLDDYVLFMALKDAHEGAPWNSWALDLRRRDPAALARTRRELADKLRLQQYVQWQFFTQWHRLRTAAHEHGIRIIGDIPIFVAFDSADVWAHPDIFYLDAEGEPTIVAGVPPDYFSKTGQRWGNPLYRWDRLAATGYAWWISRFRASLAMVDIVRIDHFRGFAAYWAVPAEESTAINGCWQPGPGGAIFEAVRAALGDVPIIAEDLGLITPDVEALRVAQGFPGMAVLQFAFGEDATNPYLPHNLDHDLVIYTGTHDNDTTAGWYAQASEQERDAVRRYVGSDGSDIAWDMIRLALASVADTAIVPLQDVLALGNEARMNLPGQLGGNWNWRYRGEQLTDAVAERLAGLTSIYGRDEASERARAK